MATIRNRWMSVADPIHGIIQFDKQDESGRLMLEIINARAFQRLRRIKQMGLAEFVFPGATHTRFSHSLGCAHLMMQAIAHFRHHDHSRTLIDSEYENTGIPIERLLLLGILAHDIGHTPLSHTLEDILSLKSKGLSHDSYWNRKILTESEDLQRIWKKYGLNLPEATMDFMGEGEQPKHFMAQLISSQLDMDRLDYLERDAHFLGVQYGRIEGERIINNLVITELEDGQPVIAVRQEALPAVEHYLFGRHQAYKMALHSLDKASEELLKKTLLRFKWARERDIHTGNPADNLFQLMTDATTMSVEEYLDLDDCYLWQAIKAWSESSADPLLKKLAKRMLKHNLLKYVNLSHYGWNRPFEELTEVYEALLNYYEERDLSLEFCLGENLVKPKAMYQTRNVREPIYVKTSHGVKDLIHVSSLPVATEPKSGEKHLIFVWDSKAREFLTEALDKHFGHMEPVAT